MYEKLVLLFRMPNFYAKHRLFFIPYAGSGASIGEPYKAALDASIDYIALQLPGRENRINEVPIDNMEEMTDLIANALLPFLDMPFSFWGHCSGALIVFEVAQRIKKLIGIEPENLFVSASASPQDAHQILKKSYHTLSDLELIDAIHELMKDAFDITKEQDAVVNILLPGIRADFKLYEEYGAETYLPLSSNIYAIGAKNDPMVTSTMLRRWISYTKGNFSVKEFSDGSHYFINTHVDPMCKYLEQILL